MNLTNDIEIKAPKENVQKIITDIENSVNVISGIDKIEILNKPKDPVVGLKWKETRTIFGKSATETMWITEATEYNYYKARAERNGAIYQTILKLSEKESTTFSAMEFNSKAITKKGKIMAFIFWKNVKQDYEKTY